MGLKSLLEKMKLRESDEPPVERTPSAPAKARPTIGEIIHRVPAPRLDEQSISGSEEIPDFPAIYRASGVKEPAHGFTAYKILEILSSPDFAALDPKAKASALSGFLRLNPAGAVAIDDVIEDALARDTALDGFEAFLRMKLEARSADRAQENADLQKGIDELARKNRERIQENLEAISKEEQRFASWQARKRIEEQKLFEAVGPFVEHNPVSVGNSSHETRDEPKAIDPA